MQAAFAHTRYGDFFFRICGLSETDHHGALNTRATLMYIKPYHFRTDFKLNKIWRPFGDHFYVRSSTETKDHPCFTRGPLTQRKGKKVRPYLLHFFAPPLERRLCADPDHVQRHGMQQLGRRYLRPAIVGRLGKFHDTGQQGICKGVLAISVVYHASICRQSEVLRGVISRDERNPRPGCHHLRMSVISDKGAPCCQGSADLQRRLKRVQGICDGRPDTS